MVYTVCTRCTILGIARVVALGIIGRNSKGVRKLGDKPIIVRMTETERKELKKLAHSHEMNVSEFIRWLIEKQRKEDGKNG
jgi:hypothetical protein